MQYFVSRVDRAVRSSHTKSAGARIRPVTRPVDIPYYVTDANEVGQATGWSPSRTVETTLDEVLEWLGRHRAELEPLLA
jgi:nucleoside-diphosphate-sugar epimerase